MAPSDKLHFSDLWSALAAPAARTALADLAGQAVHAVVVDSRAAQPNDLFIALAGEKTDGHLYLADAFSRGARAAIAEPRALELGIQAAFILPDGTIRRPEPAQGRPKADDASLPYVFVVPDSLAGLQKVAAH